MTTDIQQNNFAPINGAQIYYNITGAEHAETIFMIHAGICDHRMWQAQVEHFAQRFQIITVDLRGFGQSAMVTGAFSHYHDMLALLDYLNIEQAWLMGCSMGGKTAIDMTLTAPKRVQGLLLSGPAISGYRYTGDSHPLNAAIDAAEENGDLERISELEVQMWVDGTGRKPEDIDPAVRKLVYDMNLIPLKVDEDLWDQEEAIPAPAIEHLETINKPTLIIIGDLDVASSLERAAILGKRINGAKLVTMTGTAHVPNMEYPAQFNQIVDDFLNTL